MPFAGHFRDEVLEGLGERLEADEEPDAGYTVQGSGRRPKVIKHTHAASIAAHRRPSQAGIIAIMYGSSSSPSRPPHLSFRSTAPHAPLTRVASTVEPSLFLTRSDTCDPTMSLPRTAGTMQLSSTGAPFTAMISSPRASLPGLSVFRRLVRRPRPERRAGEWYEGRDSLPAQVC